MRTARGAPPGGFRRSLSSKMTLIGSPSEIQATKTLVVAAEQAAVVTTNPLPTGTAQKLKFLADVFINCTAGQGIVTYYLLHLPESFTLPTLTGADAWEKLRGLDVLGFRKFALGANSLPAIVRLPSRKVAAKATDDFQLIRVIQPLTTLSFTEQLNTRFLGSTV